MVGTALEKSREKKSVLTNLPFDWYFFTLRTTYAYRYKYTEDDDRITMQCGVLNPSFIYPSNRRTKHHEISSTGRWMVVNG